MDEVEAVLAALWALEDSASKGNEVEARKLQGVLKRLDGCAHDLLEGALHQTFVQRDLPVPELEPRDRWSWEQRQRVRQPQTLDQLLEAYDGAHPIGRGHTSPPADGVLIDARYLDQVERVLDAHADIDTERLIRVGAGITLGALAEVLERDALQVRHFGGELDQSLAGAVNTGRHGPGAPPLADAVVSIDVVLPTPTGGYGVQRFEPYGGITDPARCPYPLHQDDAAFWPMLCNQGTLGLACAYTLQIDDATHTTEVRRRFVLEDDLQAVFTSVRAGNAEAFELNPVPQDGKHHGHRYRYETLHPAQVDEESWLNPPLRKDGPPLHTLRDHVPPRLLGWITELAPNLVQQVIHAEHRAKRGGRYASTASRVRSQAAVPGFRSGSVTVDLDALPALLDLALAQSTLPIRVTFGRRSRFHATPDAPCATVTCWQAWHLRHTLAALQPTTDPDPRVLEQRALRIDGAKGGNRFRELLVRGQFQKLTDAEAEALLDHIRDDPDGFQRDLAAVAPMPAEAKGRETWKDWLGGNKRRVQVPRSRDVADLNALKQTVFGATGPLIRAHGNHHADNWVSPPDDDSIAIQMKRGSRQHPNRGWPDPPKTELEVFHRADGRTFVRAWGWESLKSLFDRIEDKGYAIINTGSFSGQSIAGPLSVGTHGSGTTFGSMADGVTSFDVLGTDMRVRRIRKPNCPAPTVATVNLPNDLGSYFPEPSDIPIDVGIINLGCFGIVLSYVIEVRTHYRLTQTVGHHSLDTAIDDALGKLGSRHVELLVAPEPVKVAGKTVQATVIQRVCADPTTPDDKTPKIPWIIRALTGERWLLGIFARVIQCNEPIRAAVFKGALEQQQDFTQSWRNVLIRDSGISAHGFELFVPLARTKAAIHAVLDGIEDAKTVHGIKPTAPFGVRFVKAGDQVLGMNYRVLEGVTYDAWCTIEVSRLYGSKDPETIPLCILARLKTAGIPYRTHWGQDFPPIVDLPSRYEHLDDWLIARDQIDPSQRFFPHALKAQLTNANRALFTTATAPIASQRRVLFVSANRSGQHDWEAAWTASLTAGCAIRALPAPPIQVLAVDDLFDRYAVTQGELLGSVLQAFGARTRYTMGRTSSRQWLDELPTWWEWDPERIAKWLCHPELREALRLRLYAAIRTFQPAVIVGHSLGSVIAYDTLTYAGTRASTSVDLVTLGSPVSIPGLRPHWAGIQPHPPNVRHWFNVHHREDPLFARPIGRPGVHDLETTEPDPTLHPHAAARYLQDPKVARDVWNVVLGSAQPRERTVLDVTRHARKPRRALLVGINRYQENAFPDLSGCVNDVVSMSELLQSKYGYRSQDIRVLTDQRATTEALKDRLEWLLAGTTSMDQRVFYFSGHGTQLPAYNAVEVVDRIDECLVTHDFDWNRPDSAFSDDDFMELYSQLPLGARFTAVFDCCHAAGMSRAGGGLARGISMPEDMLHRVQHYARGRWQPRTPEARREAIRGPASRLSQGFLGSAQGLRPRGTLPDATPGLRGHSGPYLPVLLYATREQDLAYEYRDGRTVQGAFTWALTRILAQDPAPSFAKLMERLQEQVDRIGAHQRPDLEGPTARLEPDRRGRFSF